MRNLSSGAHVYEYTFQNNLYWKNNISIWEI